MLAAIVRSAEGDGALDGIEQVMDAYDQARISRGGAIVHAADQLERLLNRDPRLERRGHTVVMFSSAEDSWLLNAPLRRLTQAYGVEVRVRPLARA